MYEIEKKAWVHRIADLRAALTQDFGPATKVVKDDAYFRRMQLSGELVVRTQDGLRIKEDSGENISPFHRQIRLRTIDGVSTVTAKLRQMKGNLELNREIEFQTSCPAEFESLLTEYLEFTPYVKKLKTVELFQDGNMNAELSHVSNLGWFFEVEVLVENLDDPDTAEARIDALFEKHRVLLGPEEPERYTKMLLDGKKSPVDQITD
jgi:predicted adenylyl cyclase CyaB